MTGMGIAMDGNRDCGAVDERDMAGIQLAVFSDGEGADWESCVYLASGRYIDVEARPADDGGTDCYELTLQCREDEEEDYDSTDFVIDRADAHSAAGVLDAVMKLAANNGEHIDMVCKDMLPSPAPAVRAMRIARALAAIIADEDGHDADVVLDVDEDGCVCCRVTAEGWDVTTHEGDGVTPVFGCSPAGTIDEDLPDGLAPADAARRVHDSGTLHA